MPEFRRPEPVSTLARFRAASVGEPVPTLPVPAMISNAILQGRMSAITLQLPDELALQLRAQADRLPEILELGLRDLGADSQAGFDGATAVLEVLASLPSPQEVMALRPSPRLSARIAELLSKNRDNGLNTPEQREWERYEYLEHLVRLAKANASRRLSESPGDGGS